MSHIRMRRAGAALTGLAGTWLGLAVAAPSAFASPPGAAGPVIQPSGIAAQMPPGGAGGGGQGFVTVTRTIVVGGMPGWQIALIAASAALVAAGLAVLANRARAARRLSVPSAA